MYIAGRIVHDPSSVRSKLRLMQYDLKQNKQREAMTEIGIHSFIIYKKCIFM